MSNLGKMGAFALDGQRVCERRRHKRKSVLSELGELVVVSLDSERGLLLTVSASGISVQAQAQLAPGSRVAVQFSLPSSQTAIRATCDMVWVGNNCEAGLKFLPLAESDARCLENWLTLHAAEPEDVMADAAAAGIPCAVMDEAVPASSDYADLAATIEKLVAPHPVDTAPPQPASPAPQAPAAAEADTLEDLLPRIVVQARVLTQAEGTALVLSGEEGLICRASSGSAPAVGSRMRAGSGLSAECFRLGQVVRCDDVENDSRVNSAAAQRLQSRSILIAPIRANASTRGVLQVLSSRPFAFTDAHVATLEHLAGLVAAFLAAKESANPADLHTAPSPESASGATPEPNQRAAEAEGAGTNSPELAPGRQSEQTDNHPAIAADAGLQAEEAAANAAIEAAPETATQPLDAADEQPQSSAKLLRNGTIGCLGLLTTALLLWTMVQLPQPSKAALPANAQLTPVSTTAAPAAQPLAIGSDPVKAIKATRPLVRPNRPPQAAKSAARPPKSHPAGKAGKLESMASANSSSLSLRTLPAPSLPEPANSATSAPVTAVLAAPTPTLVAPSSPVQQSGRVERGRAISQPRPVYPQAAMRAGIEGSVVLATTIGTDGKIKKVNVVSGHPLLTQAALDAVKQWRYQPSYLNGAPVEVDSSITLNFKRP